MHIVLPPKIGWVILCSLYTWLFEITLGGGVQPSVGVCQCAREPKNVLEKVGLFGIAATQIYDQHTHAGACVGGGPS